MEPQWQFKPGDTVELDHTSAAPTSPQPVTTPEASSPEAATSLPEVAPSPVTATVMTAQPEPAPAPQPATQDNDDQLQETPDTPPLLSWVSTEFITRSKSSSWYLLATGITVILTILIYLIFRDVISAGVILLAGAGLEVNAARIPKQIEYSLYPHGVAVGQHYFPFEMFRSFSVDHESGLGDVSLLPLKRFGLIKSLYFGLEDESEIMDIISSRLPLEQRAKDYVDELMKRIRF